MADADGITLVPVIMGSDKTTVLLQPVRLNTGPCMHQLETFTTMFAVRMGVGWFLSDSWPFQKVSKQFYYEHVCSCHDSLDI
jgi:hypothetical protein